MATIPARPAKRYADNLFFMAMALLVMGAVVAGFASAYDSMHAAGAVMAGITVQLDVAAFVCWMLLLLAQTAVFSDGRDRLHMQLGMLAAVLAMAMVVLGVLTATGAFRRGISLAGLDPETLYALTFLELLTFALLAASAFHARRNGPAYKRYLLLATMALLPAVLGRWPFALRMIYPVIPTVDLLLLCLIAYDSWALSRIHRATAVGALLLVGTQALMFPLGHSAAWQHFAAWAQHG